MSKIKSTTSTEAKVIILDIPFTKLFQAEILSKIEESLHHQKKLFIATPNPEMLLASQKNLEFKNTLLKTNLNLPDGNGLIWAKLYLERAAHSKNKAWLSLLGVSTLIAFLWHSKNDKKRFNKAIHGSDLTMEILRNQSIGRHSIFLLGNKYGLNSKTAELTAQKLQREYPHLKIAGHADSDFSDTTLVKKINESGAEILLVGFGAPKQEIWIYQHLDELSNLKVAIGIGGTFDFITGIIPRAPKIMRQLGLEWLFRLYKQPKRIKRIFNAALVFPYQIIKDRLVNPDKYRI